MSLELSFKNPHTEAGLDEAGRGCLAGSVFAAAVILPEGFSHPLLNDSKKMSEKARYALREVIEKEALAWAVAEVTAQRIDEINLLNASIEAMNLAVDKLKIKPEHLLIDGNRFHTKLEIPFTCMIKGDSRFLNIAAASVLAKTYRDDYMMALDMEHPEYGWAKSKGYPTKAHREAITQFGATKYHRTSFKW